MRRRSLPKISLGIAIVVCATAFGQSFDAASIRPAQAPNSGKGVKPGAVHIGCNGGPGTNDPGFFQCTFANLSMLVVQAYDLQYYQLTAPSWMTGEFFDISATVPKGATREQFRVMLQTLLAERFKMTVHREQKEMQVSSLVVAKGGPKFKESIEKLLDPNPPDAVPSASPAFDKDGFAPMKTVGPQPKGRLEIGKSGKGRFRGEGESMQDLAQRLGDVLRMPVIDATGLHGQFDYTLVFDLASAMGMGGSSMPAASDADRDTGMPIESALQSQLGLRLLSKKGPVEFLVVDHAEKVPTEN